MLQNVLALTPQGAHALHPGLSPCGSQTGVQFWTVPQTLSAGTTYKYQCGIPSHVNMIGDIVVV